MAGWQFFIWGVVGGGIVDGFEFYFQVQRNNGRIPPRWKLLGMWLGELVRVAGGGALALALGSSGEIAGAMGALAAGASAPLIIDRVRQSGAD